MADGTHIEWADATWNPLVGCTKVSPGCDNCYAEKVVNRFAGHNRAFPTTFDIVSIRDQRMLEQPLRWTEPRRIFVNSLSDLFHADVPDEFIAQVFAVMALAPQHTFQLLTKRHARMRALVSRPAFAQRVGELALTHGVDLFRDDPAEPGDPRFRHIDWPLPNVWLGVSVEDQHWAETRIPALLQTPAALRWISAEPLLGPIWLGKHGQLLPLQTGSTVDFTGIEWVVAGGESGTSARRMHATWARSLRNQCRELGIPFLFKQWGHHDHEGRPVGKAAAGRELDGRTHDEYPTTLTGAPA